MIVEMENYKFEVKNVIHLKAIDTITSRSFVIMYLSWNSVTCLMPVLVSYITKEKYACF